MNLPPFTELRKYASGKDELPQRFYSPEFHLRLADWKLNVDGTTLPIHSQVVSLISSVYCGMLDDGVTDQEVSLNDCTLPCGLALLRLMYHGDTLTTLTIEFLFNEALLADVLRVAHKLNCSFFESLSSLTADFIKKSNLKADGGLNAILDIREVASQLKITKLQTLCCSLAGTACSETIRDIRLLQHNRSDYQSGLARFSDFIASLGNSREMLEAALLVACFPTVDKEQIHKMLHGPETLPLALFTWKVYNPYRGTSVTKRQLTSHWFLWDNNTYRLLFLPFGEDDSKSHCSLFLQQKGAPQDSDTSVELTFQMFNCISPEKSTKKCFSHCFVATANSIGFNKFEEVKKVLKMVDEDNFLFIQVVSMNYKKMKSDKWAKRQREGE